MKAIPFKIPKTDDASLRVQVDEGKHFYGRLHYHPEYQLTAILQGEGMIYLGNHFTRFAAGDVFLIGSNIPHLLKNPPLYDTEESPGVYAVSLFFADDSFGRVFFQLPEMKSVQALLQMSRRGLRIQGGDELAEKLVGMVDRTGLSLMVGLLEILHAIEQSQVETINSEAYKLDLNEQDGVRMNQVLNYTLTNMHREISLPEIAEIANLSTSQFSRYFKLHTRKTYVQFLNGLRVEAACDLLHNRGLTVESICYEVGFNNLSNFNRQFRKLKSLSPSQYRKRYL